MADITIKIRTELSGFDDSGKKVKQFTQEIEGSSEALKEFGLTSRKIRNDQKKLAESLDFKPAVENAKKFTKEVGLIREALPEMIGGLATGAISFLADQLAQFAIEGTKAYMSLDKLTRLTATLDKNFRSPESLKKLRTDIQQLSKEVPQTADSLAIAAFTIKKAYRELSEGDLTFFLREFSLSAALANETVDKHAAQLVALAKQYGVTKENLRDFFAFVNSELGETFISNEGLNKSLAKLTIETKGSGISISELAAAMITLNEKSASGELKLENLNKAFRKLSGPELKTRLKSIFNIDFLDSASNPKKFTELLKELGIALAKLPTQNDKLAKLNEVFKDSETAKGILLLIQNVEKYNAELSKGGDAKTFQENTDLMLNSAESRWDQFYNRVAEIATQLGEDIAETSLAALESDWIDGLQVVGSKALEKGFQLLANNNQATWTAKISNDIADSIVLSLFPGPETEAKLKEARERNNYVFSSFYDFIDGVLQSNTQRVIKNSEENAIEFWRKQLNDPNATEAAKIQAEANIRRLMQNIGETQAAEWKKQAQKLSEELKSNNPVLVKAATKQIEELRTTLQNAINNKTFSASITQTLEKILQSLPDTAEKQGTKTGELFGGSLLDSLKNYESPFDKLLRELAENSAQDSKPTFRRMGFTLGGTMIDGITAGLSNTAPVASATRAIAISARRTAKHELQEASPSKVFIRIGQDVVRGFAIGIEGQAPLALEKIRKFADDAVKKARETQKELKKVKGTQGKSKELQEAEKEFNKLKDLTGSQLKDRATVADTQKMSSDLQQIEKLRQELRSEAGVDITAKLPSDPASIAAELQRLNAIKAYNEEFKNLGKQSEQELDRLREQASLLEAEIAKKDKLTETEKKQIENAAELARYRKELKDEKGLDHAQIEKLAAKKTDYQKQALDIQKLNAENQRRIELNNIIKGFGAETAKEALKLEEEIKLLGAKNAAQEQAIKNEFILKALEAQMANDGFSKEQIEAAKKAKQEALDNLAKLQGNKSYAETMKQYGAELDKVNESLGINIKLTEKQRLENDLTKGSLKGLTDEQKEALRKIREEIDLKNQQLEDQKKFEEAAKKLGDSFNNIFQSLLKGGPKAALKTAFGEIKKAFLDEVNKLVSGIAQSLAKFTMKSLFGGLFGGGKESAAGEGGGQNGGTGNNTTPGGAIQNALGNSGLFGKLLGKIPIFKGLFGGGTKVAGEAGSQAASGGLSFAKLGAFFSNPYTIAAIGAGVAAFFIFRSIFADKSIKRLREAIQSSYGIAVKDKNVLKQIKQIGEQQLGKGAASKRPGEVIKLEEAKELIRAHAEATGQKTDKLGASRADYGNENSAVNRQIAPFGGFRALGGMVRAGMAYVVGERRPELFIPQQNGFIQPNFAFAGGGNFGGFSNGFVRPQANGYQSGNFHPQATRNSGDNGDGLLALALSQLQETMGRFEAKLQALSPGHVLAMGADENPSVIPDNVLREADSNPGFSDKFLTKTGQKW